ncbi:acyltransferase family protein [Limnohabitans sp.]|uniref:acyltransferase family protein n=1 Tax=Limnohabitans sp. TaxID=1907725 RepID=UPI0025BB8709|nr:acyltransferase family protein [Limnohabitans sp.]
MSHTAQRPSGRSFLIDAIKAAGCLLIVLHHLAFYGPMSDVVAAAWPGVVHWLYDHGRLAVQFFLVCAGFLTAGSLARYATLDLSEALKLTWQRYLRLVIPLLAALSFTVLVSEWVRPGFEHASLSAPPDWGQALAHVALLQHVLDLEALSAGIWYVAIDLQLYAMALGCLVLLKAWPRAQTVPASVQGADGAHWGDARRWALWWVLVCASLWWWNLDADLDDLGVYFWGSYGVGLLAWEARRQAAWARGGAQARFWMMGVMLVLVGSVAWWLEPRSRIAVAWGVAALLVAVPELWFGGEAIGPSRWKAAVQWLSGVSYSVFLIHFGVSLAVNAAVTAYWPDALWANALGMLLALLLSLLLGSWLHGLVERQPPTVWRWWFWVGAFKASVALALLMNPMV